MNAPRPQISARLVFIAFTLLGLLLSARSVRAAAEADLLVAYDQTYTASAGGHDNVQVLAANAVAGSNAINERCGTGARVRIVGYHEAAQYSYQRTSKGGYIGWMANYDSRLSDVVDAGNARGADLVTFLCVSTSDGAAAVAQQPGRYSAFDPGQFWSTVVAHELAGHNYSCDHRGGRLEPKTVMMHNYCGGGAQGYYSNSNIWLNGVRLVGEGSCLGDAVNGGDNSLLISTTAQGVADRYSRVVAAPRLSNVVRRWAFNQPAAGAAPAGTTLVDTVNGSALATVQGSGATFTGSGLRLPGGAAGSGAAYLQLPAGVVSGYANVTIEIWAAPLAFQTWGRLLDFNNGSTNYLTLSTANGSGLGTQRFESNIGGAAVSLDSGLPTTVGALRHYAITFADNGAGGGRWTWYRDGDAVAWLDVAYPLSSFPDVNNWLGRSAYAADAFANCEYAEVRISNIALTRDEVLANFALGPNRQSSDVNLTADDPLGQASFNATGRWSDGLAPSATKTYETANFRLRTPADTVSRTFTGKSLKISGGSLTWKGTASGTLTIGDLRLAGSPELIHAGSGTWTLAGNLTIETDTATVRAANGPIVLSASLAGTKPVAFVNNPITLSGNNTAFAGKILVGDGRAGILAIDSEARLGPNPSTLVTGQLTLNRGTIQVSGTQAIDDPNRGILLDINGGVFNVAAGGNLTLSSPLYSRDLGSSVVAGAIGKSGAGTLILNSPGSTFRGALYVDSGSTAADDGAVRVANNQVLASANGPVFINNTTNGSSRLQLDGGAGNITLPRVFLAGRNGSAPAVQNLAGSNTLRGLTLNAGGSNYLVQSDVGTLTFNADISSAATGNRTLTFQGAGNITVTAAIAEGGANSLGLAKLGAGTLVLSGACSHDGATTLSGGTLRLDGSFSGAGTMTTAAGTMFSGSGSSSAATNINGVHAPGAASATGAQTFTGTVAYGSAARLNWNLAANTTSAANSNRVAAQSVTVSSGAAVNLTLNGPGGSVDFTNAFWTQIRVWPLISATAMSGQFTLGTISADSAGRAVSAYGSFHLQQSSAGVSIVFYPLGSTPPSAPAGLSAANSPGAVSLSWTPSSGAVSYHIRRSTSSGGPYETVATDVAASPYIDNSVLNGTAYYYVVAAVNAFGESDDSAEIVATPRAPAVIDKADNTLALNLPGSWTGSALPTAWDGARWTGLPAVNTVALGSNLALNGLTVGATGGPVGISAGNTLTLGTGGVNLAAATQNLSIASGLALAAGQQSWSVATGRVFTLSGALSRAGGAVLVVDKSIGAGAVTASATTNVNGIVGPWALVKSAGAAANNSSAGHAYAAKDGSNNLVAYVSAISQTATSAWGGIPSGGTGTLNYDINAAGTLGATGLLRSVNTLRYTGPGARQPGNNGGDLIALNGLMNAGTGTLTLGNPGANVTNDFSFGVLIGANNELVLAPMTADIVLHSFIKDGSGGAGAITITGYNAVVLAGANTFTGGVHLASGSLRLATDNAIGSGVLRIHGGDIRASGAVRTLTNSIVLNGSFTLGRSTNFSGPVTLANDVVITSANPDTQTAASSAFSGVISGTRGLSFTEGANPTGTILLSGINTYSGGTTLAAGTLQLGNAAALGAANGNLAVNSGVLNLAGFSPTVARLSGSRGVIVNLAAGTATLTTNTSSNSTFAGSLQNGAAGQVLALTKRGPGTLTLAGVNTHTGATTVSSGGLHVTGALAGPVSVATGASLSGSGTIQGAVSLATGARLRWTLPVNSAATDAAGRISAGVVNVASGALIDLVFDSPGSTVDFTDAFWTQPRSWILMTASNKTGDLSLGTIGSDSTGRQLSFYGSLALQQNATSVTLTFTPSASPLSVWRFQQFGVYVDTPEALAGDTEDPDGDGLANLLEYSLGTDPKTPGDAPVAISRAGDFLVFTYDRRSPADPALVYTVQASDNLADGFGTATGSTLTTGSTSTYTDNVALGTLSSRRFLRLSVSYTSP